MGHAPLDQVHFGRKQADPADPQPPGGQDERHIGNGVKEAVKAVFNKNGLIDDTAWVAIASVALFFIPGHQILSVPVIYGIGAAFRAVGGFAAGVSNEKYIQGSWALRLLKKLGIGGKDNS